MTGMRVVLASVTAYAGAEIVIPHLTQDWKVIAGAAIGTLCAHLLNIGNLRKAVAEALAAHEKRYHATQLREE